MKSLLPTLVNAASVLAVQVFALVTLAPASFGLFSIQYLLFALGSSLSLSLISEAWLRADLRGGGRTEWAEYSSAVVYLALATGSVTLVVSLLVPDLRPVAGLGALAVAAAIYRGAARYYSVRIGQSRGVLVGDFVGLAAALALWVPLFASGNRELWMMTMVWAVASLGSAVLSKPPRILAPSMLRVWRRNHSQEIRQLLRDSLLMDAGAIGTPYLLLPMLGLNDFGIYRAISNVAAPVRLVLNPLRPQLALASLSSQRTWRRICVVVSISLLFGAGAYYGLLAVGFLGLALGSLTEIVVFALPAAVFVSASFWGQYYMIVARGRLEARRLLAGRLAQTVMVIIFPVVGVITAGLSGAIWGYAIATVLWAFMWLVLIVNGRQAASANDSDSTEF